MSRSLLSYPETFRVDTESAIKDPHENSPASTLNYAVRRGSKPCVEHGSHFGLERVSNLPIESETSTAMGWFAHVAQPAPSNPQRIKTTAVRREFGFRKDEQNAAPRACCDEFARVMVLANQALSGVVLLQPQPNLQQYTSVDQHSSPGGGHKRGARPPPAFDHGLRREPIPVITIEPIFPHFPILSVRALSG